MREISHSLFLHNNQRLSSDFFDYSILHHTPSIYEVLRIINRTPLFLKAHLERLFASVETGKLRMKTTYNELLDKIKRLIDMNDIGDMNIKIVVLFEEGIETDILVYFNVSRYPTEKQYETGVKLGFFDAIRENPSIKFVRQQLREQTMAKLEAEGLYETLLVDNEGNITEGSRTNVFFVKNSALYTPPANSVLLGITRQATIELAHKRGFQLFEKNIAKEELQTYDAAFITGTSPMLLPVSQIENKLFAPDNFIMRSLMAEYHLHVHQDLENFSFPSLYKL